MAQWRGLLGALSTMMRAGSEESLRLLDIHRFAVERNRPAISHATFSLSGYGPVWIARRPYIRRGSAAPAKLMGE
jgi:hypothetical protein